jgi:hypothetical protein
MPIADSAGPGDLAKPVETQPEEPLDGSFSGAPRAHADNETSVWERLSFPELVLETPDGVRPPRVVAQSDPPPAPPADPETKRNRNRMPIIALPSDGFKPPSDRWSRLPSLGAGYIDQPSNPLGYDADYSMFFRDTYGDVANPGEETIVWDFISPMAQRNLTSRSSAASVQFHYVSTGDELSVNDWPKYNLEVTVWDRRFPEGKVINKAKESSPLIRDSLTLFAGVSARDPGIWTLRRTRNGEGLADEFFQVSALPAFSSSAYIPPGQEWATLAGDLYRNSGRAFGATDELLVNEKRYPVADLLQDIVPPPDPEAEPEEQDPVYAKKCEVFWHWYSPDASDNKTALGSYLSFQLFYRQNAAGTRYTLRTKIWDSRYPNGRLQEFRQVENEPLLQEYTIRYGAGLPRAGGWTFKEVVNAGAPVQWSGSGSYLANGPPADDGTYSSPFAAEIMPPELDLHPDASVPYVVHLPALETMDEEQAATIQVGIDLLDAETHQRIAGGVNSVVAGQPYQLVTLLDTSSIPLGSVVIAKPYVIVSSQSESDGTETTTTSGTSNGPPLNMMRPWQPVDDQRIAYGGWGSAEVTDGEMPLGPLLAQDLEITTGGSGTSGGTSPEEPPGGGTTSTRYDGQGCLYPQQVIPADAACRQFVAAPGSVTQEIDAVTGRTRHSVTDLAIRTA